MRGKTEERIKISLNEYCKCKINSMTDSTVYPLSYSLQYDLDHKGYVYDVEIRTSHWQQIYTTYAWHAHCIHSPFGMAQ